MLNGDKFKKILSFSMVLGSFFLYGSNAYSIIKGKSSVIVNQMIGVPWSSNNPGVFVSPQFFAKTLELTIGNDSNFYSTSFKEDSNFNNKIKRAVKNSELRIEGQKISSYLEKTR